MPRLGPNKQGRLQRGVSFPRGPISRDNRNLYPKGSLVRQVKLKVQRASIEQRAGKPRI